MDCLIVVAYALACAVFVVVGFGGWLVGCLVGYMTE